MSWSQPAAPLPPPIPPPLALPVVWQLVWPPLPAPVAHAAIAAGLFGRVPLYLALFNSALVLGSVCCPLPGVCVVFSKMLGGRARCARGILPAGRHRRPQSVPERQGGALVARHRDALQSCQARPTGAPSPGRRRDVTIAPLCNPPRGGRFLPILVVWSLDHPVALYHRVHTNYTPTQSHMPGLSG